MAAILSLNNASLLPALTEWTEICDLACLDTAFCNRAERAAFLKLIGNDNFVHDTTQTLLNNNQYLSWLILRHLKVKNLSLVELADRKIPVDFLNYFASLKRIRRISSYVCDNLTIVLNLLKVPVDCLALCARGTSITDSQVLKLLTTLKKCSVKGLDLSWNSQITKDVCTSIVEYLPDLEYFNGTVCDNLSPKGLVTLASGCHNLLEVLVSHTDDEAVMALADNCVLLKSFSVSRDHTRHISDPSILNLFEKCVHLEHIKISAAVSDVTFGAMVKNCANLTSIIVRNSLISDNVLVLLSQSDICLKLKHFDIKGSPYVTDKGVCAVVKASKQLTVLNLSSCVNVSDVCVDFIAENCPRLLTEFRVECQNVNDHSVLRVMEKCPLLSHVSGQSKVLSQSVIIKAAENATSFKYQPVGTTNNHFNIDISSNRQYDKIVTVQRNQASASPGALFAISHNAPRMLSFSLKGFETGLSDIILFTVFENCPLLRIVSLVDCPTITVKSVLKLGELCADLESLEVNKIPTLTDNHLITFLTSRGAKMKVLKLETCSSLTNTSVLQIAELCPLLHTLSVKRNEHITHASVNEVVKQCPLLNTLILSECVLIGDPLLQTILTHSDKLTTLEVMSCDLITKDAVVAFLMQYRNLLTFDYDGFSYSYNSTDNEGEGMWW